MAPGSLTWRSCRDCGASVVAGRANQRSLMRALRQLFRWLLFSTALLALTALVTLRLGLHWLDDDLINELVEPLVPNEALKVKGTRVAWLRWRPQLAFDEVRFGASVARDVYVELAPFASARYRVPVFYRASAGALRLKLARTESGWGLADMPPPAGFNWRRVLWRSQVLTTTGQVEFIDGPVRSSLGLKLSATNTGPGHRFEVILEDEACQTVDCWLAVGVTAFDDRSDGLPASVVLRSGTGGLRLPRAVTGDRELALEELLLRFHAPELDLEPEFSLAGRIALASPENVEAPTRVNIVASGAGVTDGGAGRFALSLEESAGQARTGTDGLLRFGPGQVDIAIGELSLIDLRRAIDALLPSTARLRRWIDELELAGDVRNAIARYRWSERQLAWALDLSNAKATSYRGIPTVSGLDARITGYERGFAAEAEINDGRVGFPTVFSSVWPVTALAATVNLHLRDDYLSVWSEDLTATLPDRMSRTVMVNRPTAGRFRLGITPEPEGRRLALDIGVPAASVALSKQFLPAGLSEDLKDWLRTAPRAGVFEQARIAFIGDLEPSTEELDLSRRLALQTQFVDAQLAYAKTWPTIDHAAGLLRLSGRRVFASLSGGSSRGINLLGSVIRIEPEPGAPRFVDLDLTTTLTVDQALDFVRRSPLEEQLGFVDPDWSGAGTLALGGRMQIPLEGKGDAATGLLEVELKDAALAMPGYGLAYSALRGRAILELPNQVTGRSLSGRLHGEPFEFAVASDPQRALITFSGGTTPVQISRILSLPDVPFAAGRTTYSGTLSLPLAPKTTDRRRGNSADVAHLELASDLRGLTLELPGELAKRAKQTRATRVDVEFHPQEQWLTLAQEPLAGWFTVRDGVVVDGHAQLRGTPEAQAVGTIDHFARRRPADGTNGQGVRVTGGIGRYDLAEISDETSLGGTVFRFDAFHIAALRAGDLLLDWVDLNGSLSDEAMTLAVAGARLNGRVSVEGDEPLLLDFDSVLLPDPYASGAPLAQLDTREVTDALIPQAPDPLEVALIDELPAARVQIGSLTFGEEDFGSWRFELVPGEGDIRVEDLEADWLGLHITGEDVLWRREPNETVFVGRIEGGDLHDILPRWGYASPMANDSTRLDAEVVWAGSPLNLVPLELEGEVTFLAKNGRFEDMEAAGNNALRLLSLLNFNALARRMNFDFSDVFGRGISFEEISAQVALDHGRMVFLEPMEVDGTGSSFVLSGTVDLRRGLLENELIVTLPLTKGVPWYAAYVALANPLAGLGVLVGERVLRKPLEQLSSAKYEVSGAITDPEVKLVGIFNNRLNKVVTEPEDLETE